MTISTKQYTEGLCGDGAAILCDGIPLSICEILAALQSGEAAKAELLAVREAQSVPTEYNQVQRDMMKDILVRNLGGNLIGHKLVMADIHTVTMALMNAGFRLHTAPPAPAVQQCFHDAIDDMENVMAWIMKLPVPTDGATAKAGRLKNSISACRAALLQPVSQGYTLNSPVIPDGWKLVPIVELTEKMVIHGFESEAFEALADAVQDKKGWPYSCRESAECVTGIFKAMVEVAPSPGGLDDSHATAT